MHEDARKSSCVHVGGFEKHGGVVDYGKWLKIGSAIRIDRKGRFLPCDFPTFHVTA